MNRKTRWRQIKDGEDIPDYAVPCARSMNCWQVLQERRTESKPVRIADAYLSGGTLTGHYLGEWTDIGVSGE